MNINTLEITELPEGLGFTGIRELVNQTLGKNFGAKFPPGAVPTGFKELDRCLGGLQSGQLYTVAVRPGMGKTAFLLSLANNMAIKDNYSVAIFSAERSGVKMTRRLIESETGMSIDKLQQDDMKDSQKDHLLSLLGNIAKAGILFDDTHHLTVEELSRKAKHLKNGRQADVIIVDYLELLTSAASVQSDPSGLQIEIMGKIRHIAAETGIPIVLFTQASSAVNGYDISKKPSAKGLPAHLREASDVLMLMHRNDAFTTPSVGTKSNVELMVLKKNTTEEEKIVPLHFIDSIAKFTDHS
jgi:replicative DNA helicase